MMFFVDNRVHWKDASRTIAIDNLPNRDKTNAGEITALEIKKAIEEKEGLPVESQMILFAGDEWEDQQTYAEISRQCYPTSAVENPNYITRLDLLRHPIPLALRPFVKLNFKELTEYSADLACELSQKSRTTRYNMVGHPDTESYWNKLGQRERAEILSGKEYISVLHSLTQKRTSAENQQESSSSQNTSLTAQLLKKAD